MPDQLLDDAIVSYQHQMNIPDGRNGLPLTAEDREPASIHYEDDVKGKTRHSKRLPPWLWIIIAKSLGIKLGPGDQPILSSMLHVLTVGAGAGMIFTNAFYAGYDISSVHSPTDIMDGMVSVFIVTLYCALGIYSHRLAYRLFVHPKFLEKVRLHAKTIMKINAALIVFLVIAVFVVVQNLWLANYLSGYDSSIDPNPKNGTIPDPDTNPCQTIQIPVEICQSFYMFQLIFSLFFLLWNALVAMVLISVARTHTIDLRGFMRELGFDAHLQDKQFRKSYYAKESVEAQDTLREYQWVDNDNITQMLSKAAMEQSITTDNHKDTSSESHATQPTTLSGNDIENDVDAPTFSSQNVQLQLDGQDSSISPELAMGNRFQRLSEERDPVDSEEKVIVPHIMTEQEIMHKYWKLMSACRLTSMAFQRWMCVVTVTVLLWSAIRVIFWLSHTPTLYGILSFVLPLLLLPLLSSAYAEVNYEGQKVLQSILPTPARVQMFQYLYGAPIMMTAYGHRISYGTMGTVLAAILAAFMSKILLQEMSLIIK